MEHTSAHRDAGYPAPESFSVPKPVPQNRSAQRGANTDCHSGLCSVGLMRSLCPTCVLLGLALLPLELVGRGIRKLFGTVTG